MLRKLFGLLVLQVSLFTVGAFASAGETDPLYGVEFSRAKFLFRFELAAVSDAWFQAGKIVVDRSLVDRTKPNCRIGASQSIRGGAIGYFHWIRGDHTFLENGAISISGNTMNTWLNVTQDPKTDVTFAYFDCNSGKSDEMTLGELRQTLGDYVTISDEKQKNYSFDVSASILSLALGTEFIFQVDAKSERVYPVSGISIQDQKVKKFKDVDADQTYCLTGIDDHEITLGLTRSISTLSFSYSRDRNGATINSYLFGFPYSKKPEPGTLTCYTTGDQSYALLSRQELDQVLSSVIKITH